MGIELQIFIYSGPRRRHSEELSNERSNSYIAKKKKNAKNLLRVEYACPHLERITPLRKKGGMLRTRFGILRLLRLF